MLILALDTTTRAGSVAVLRDDETLALVSGDAARTHAERLPGELQDALTRAGAAMAEIDLLAVAAGPGAFTGLRIGLATIQGLAMTLGKPVVGVSSLDALAASLPGVGSRLARHSGPPGRDGGESGTGSREPGVGSRESEEHSNRLIGCWIDAQRGEVYAALYSGALDAIDPPGVDTPAGTIARWRNAIARQPVHSITVTGDGAARYSDALAQARMRTVAAPDLAPFIGRIARARAAAGHAGPPHALAPIYIRRPDVEIERDRHTPS